MVIFRNILRIINMKKVLVNLLYYLNVVLLWNYNYDGSCKKLKKKNNFFWEKKVGFEDKLFKLLIY